MGWKWKKWKGMLPYSSCLCFGRKQWQPIAEDEEPQDPRRGGISFDKSDKNAMYVRRLGDVKVRPKPDSSSRESRRRGSLLLDPDFKILENLEHSHYRSRCGLKFLSLHRVRRRRRGVLKCSRDNASILDDHYSGQAKCLLSTVGGWDFNVFNLDKLTNGRSLFHMCLHLFQDLNLITTFNLDIVKLMRCFTMIEEGYHSNNPYHNSVHAADVTQAMFCFLQEEKVRQHITPLESMIALLSAATHDLDHPGVNQAFLIATSNPLATLYKNSSVLENHHWRSAVGVLHESGVFSHLDQDTRNNIEWLMKSLILATDITRQQEFLSKFKRHLENNDLCLEDDEHRHFTLQIALKCADICNPCKPWALSKQWSERVCDEFFKQGDYERKLQIPVTPLCDRYEASVAKIQSGFMQFVVLPLFTEWANFNPTTLSHLMLQNIRFNKSGWDRIIQETEAEKQKEPDTAEDSSGDENCDTNKENEVVTLASVHQEKSNSLTSSSHTDQEDCPVPVADGTQPRRHSLPPPAISKDLKIAFPRRGSFPKVHGNHVENSSKLTKLLNNKHKSTSVEKLAKLDSLAEASPPAKQDWSQDVFSYDLDDDRPKITSLSFEYQKGRLLRLGTHSAQVHPLTDQMVSYSQRYRHGRGSLPSIRLSQPSRIMLKDLEDESSSSKYNHHSQTDSLASSATACKNTVIGVRHILGALNTNAKMSMHDEPLRHSLYDRPRSLSLEIESQPLLRMHSQFNHHNTTAGSEIGEEEEISQCACPPSQSNPIFSESQELLEAESLLREERTSASVPLLPEQFTSRPPGGCSHAAEQ